MKLPDFTKDAGLNALRQIMGAALGVLKPAENRDVLTREEIDALTKQGIDVPLDAVKVLSDGTLAYKNSRVILYIRDIAQYRDGEQVNLPRFHVADCRTLADMRANNRFQRYVVAIREDGLFALNILRQGPGGMTRKITERLSVCQNCLGKLRWDGFESSMNKPARGAIVGRFSIARFFTVYGKTLVTERPQYDANTAPLNEYSDQFPALAARIKVECNYTCATCGIHLTSHQKYLHAHHRNGQKSDDSPENIAILCVACHAEQYQHGHLKGLPDYLEFLRLRPSLITAPPSDWVAAAQEVAQTHKLAVQDARSDGGCLWVVAKDARHPAVAQLKALGFQFSVKRQAFWRKD